MEKEELFKILQENQKENNLDEMEKHYILRSTRIFALVFLIIMTITFVINLLSKNVAGFSENIAILLITLGFSDFYLDKKNNNKTIRKILDLVLIIIGIIFYIIFIFNMFGK